MKVFYLIIVGVAMLGSSQLFAKNADGCADCHVEDRIPSTTNGFNEWERVLTYSEDQYKTLADTICFNLELYKEDPSIFKVKTDHCPLIPEDCDKGKKTLPLKSLIRTDIASALSIETNTKLESELPAILNKLSAYKCDAIKIGAIKQGRRNFIKMAVYMGLTDSFFDDFLFDELQVVENGNRKLKIDINTIERVNGKDETILDYLNNYLENYDIPRLGNAGRDNVERLRNMLVDKGALTNAQLKQQRITTR